MTVLGVSDYALSHLGQSASGRVHSVFSSSLNVEFDGFLLHIGSSEAPLSCLGAAVSVEAAAELLAVTERGDEARFRNGILRIYSRAKVSTLDLGSAPRRSMRVEGLVACGPDGFDAVLLRELRSLKLAERIGLPWPELSQAAVGELARFSAVCMRAQEQGESPLGSVPFEGAVRAMRSAVEHLVGRGLGLTPAGDDVLLGYGAALHFLYRDRASNAVQVFFKTVSEVVPGKTTAVSEAYFQAMVEGCANEDYLELFGAIRAHDAAALVRTLGRVSELGHSSGADGLVGFGAAFGCLI